MSAELQWVLLSGRVSSGKTTLARVLVNARPFLLVRTAEMILQRLPMTPRTRVGLQEAGEYLDRQTEGQWVAADLFAQFRTKAANVVVDSVRTRDQIMAIRRRGNIRVVHVHVTASKDVLEVRYSSKGGFLVELREYTAMANNATESQVEQLAGLADVVIDTTATQPEVSALELVRRLDRTCADTPDTI